MPPSLPPHVPRPPSSQLLPNKLLALLAHAVLDNHSEDGALERAVALLLARSLGGCQNRRRVSLRKGGGTTLLLLAALCACGTDIHTRRGGTKKSAVGGTKNGKTESDGWSGGWIRKEGVAVSW